ncbi:MAG: hypothetical protein Q6J68_06255 [Thermostichales cyanobacterium SZTDM-1c_bins_54]
MDPKLIEAARRIYQHYQQQRPDVLALRPRGVAVHSRTLRGDLIFSEQPVLLPLERFIPLEWVA